MSRRTVLVALGFVMLVGITTTLASFYHRERTSRAVEHFERGERLRASGQLEAAALDFRTALSLARSRVDYQLALGLTLLDAGHTREAVTYLDDVLQADPTSGVANRARAEAARALGDLDEVPTYYRRAVHGVWPPESAARRQQTRLAFIEFLLGQQQRAEALGELGELAAEVSADSPARLRVASLLLAASAPDQAANILRAVVESSPRNVEAWQRLAEAEFTLGAYRAAAGAAKRALAIGPASRTTADLLGLAESVIAMDPTATRLPVSEQQRRSRQILERSVAALDACVDNAEGPELPEVAELRKAAAQRLEPQRAGRGNGVVEANLGVATLVWRTTRRLCSEVPPDEVALDLVMRRIAGEGTSS